jgi:hypothetical protein
MYLWAFLNGTGSSNSVQQNIFWEDSLMGQ